MNEEFAVESSRIGVTRGCVTRVAMRFVHRSALKLRSEDHEPDKDA